MESDPTTNTLSPETRDALTAQLTSWMESGRLAEVIDDLKNQLAQTTAPSAVATQLDKIAALLNNRGVHLSRDGKSEAALTYFTLALRASEKCAPALNNAAACLKDLGRLDESNLAYQQVLVMQPHLAAAHSNLLFNMHYKFGVTPQELQTAHRAWDQQHGSGHPSPAPHFNQTRDSDRALHVGLVSPDFGQHPVGIFLIRFLENSDRNQIILHAYATKQRADLLADRFRHAIPHWHDVHAMNGDALTNKIREDGIDILIDLSGHSANDKLEVFARKPAPIQMTWIGYPGETGLSAIDYVIGDRFVLPHSIQATMHAKILQLPNGFVCFDPPRDAPPVADLPATMPGAVTFGCFHNPAKCGTEVLAVWAEILKRLPQSRLLMKYAGFGASSTQKRLQDQFAALGIDASQLEFQGASPLPEMFAEMNRIDIALDSFPFSGGLMSCYTLWMGLPLITLPLESFASRQGLCFLSLMGMTETIAANPQDYIDKAVMLAKDLTRLTDLRKRLRATMEASPLCNAELARTALQNVLRAAWRDWCKAI